LTVSLPAAARGQRELDLSQAASLALVI